MRAEAAREIASTVDTRPRTSLPDVLERVRIAAENGVYSLDVGRLPDTVRKSLLDMGYRCSVHMAMDYNGYETTIYW